MRDTASKAVQTRLLTFRLGTQRFAVDIVDVQEIVRVSRITRLPRATAHVRGVVNLRGRLLTVHDLGLRLGMAACESGSRSSILVLASTHAGQRVVRGFLVDRVEHVVDLEPDSVQPPPQLGDDFDASCLRGVARTESGLIRVVDAAPLLGAGDVLAVDRP